MNPQTDNQQANTGAVAPEPVTPAPFISATPVVSSPIVSPAAPAMAAAGGVPMGPAPASMLSFNSMGPGSVRLSFASLGLCILAVVICLLLIFAPSLISSLTMAYVWFFVVLGLGAAGLVTGLLHQKKSEKLHLGSLVGIILGVIVCLNAVLIGAYYIKLRMEIGSISSYSSSSSSSDLGGSSSSSTYDSTGSFQ